MKKFLLLATLAASMVTAKADDFSQYFKVTCDGTEYTNGQTVTIDTYYDEYYLETPEEITPDTEFEYMSQASIIATNISNSSQKLNYTLKRNIPTLEESPLGGPAGYYQLCYRFNDHAGNCTGAMESDPIVKSPADIEPIAAGGYLQMDVDQTAILDFTPATFQLDLSVSNVPGAEATFYITFTHQKDITLAVDKIEAAEQPEVYFNLQGIRVTNPEKGNIYVVRKGSKVYKKMF